MYNIIQIYLSLKYLSLKGGRNVSRPKGISFFLDSNTYLYTYNTSILWDEREELDFTKEKGNITDPKGRALPRKRISR